MEINIFRQALVKGMCVMASCPVLAEKENPYIHMSKIPHPFVVETIKFLEDLPADETSKVWFIHMNHTNPLLNAQSNESKLVRSSGFNIAVEGIRLDL